MRKTITISVSDEMYRLVHEGARSHYSSSVSEYVRFLVRRDQRPETLIREEPASEPLRTANQCIEDAAREREAEEALLRKARAAWDTVPGTAEEGEGRVTKQRIRDHIPHL